MKAAMIAGLAEKTGKPLPEWLEMLREKKLTRHKEIVGWLKAEQELTHGFANMIPLRAQGSDSHAESDTDGLAEAQYAGAKAGLRPIHDALLATIGQLGPAVEVSRRRRTSACAAANSSRPSSPRRARASMSGST